jgi:hypothetical protein
MVIWGWFIIVLTTLEPIKSICVDLGLRCSRLTTPLQARKHLKMGTVAPVNSW